MFDLEEYIQEFLDNLFLFADYTTNIQVHLDSKHVQSSKKVRTNISQFHSVI